MLISESRSSPVPAAAKDLCALEHLEQDSHAFTWVTSPGKPHDWFVSRLIQQSSAGSQSVPSKLQIAILVHKGHETSPTSQIEQWRSQHLEFKLLIAFDETFIEDGVSHPAEQILDEALHSAHSEFALSWLRALFLNVDRPLFTSSVLRCLGRRQPGNDEWRAEIVRLAIESNDVEVRDAAVQAAESWGGSEIRSVLQRHTEEITWLRTYINEVVENIVE